MNKTTSPLIPFFIVLLLGISGSLLYYYWPASAEPAKEEGGHTHLAGHMRERQNMDDALYSVQGSRMMLEGKLNSGDHRMRDALESHRNTLGSLKSREAKLVSMREVFIQEQLRIEREIIENGGSVDASDYRVWSPDYKRYDTHRTHNYNSES